MTKPEVGYNYKTYRKMTKEKWYNKWWIKVAAVLVIIYLLYSNFQSSTLNHNLQEIHKTEINELKKQIIERDSLYNIAKNQKEKIKIIREKISIQSELDRLEILTKQLEEIKVTKLEKIDSIGPEDLQIYLQKELR